MRRLLATLLLLGFVFLDSASAQQPPSPDTDSTTCTFADGKQISVRFSTGASSEHMPMRDAWGPGGAPMYLFTQTDVTAGTANLTAGAYSMYLIEGKPWKLIINKDVKEGAKYDSAKDIARIPMQSGELPTPVKQLRPYFVHTAPQQCNLRLYYGSTGAWAEFKEK